MFGTLNRIELIGRLGKDPEMNVTPDGTPVTKFSLAVDRYMGKDPQGKPRNETDWFNIVAWKGLAELVERFIHKGQLVYVAGRLSMRTYTDREGVKRQAVEVVANDVQLLEKTQREQAENYTPAASNAADAFLPDYPDDIS